jgi:hypothetical protein
MNESRWRTVDLPPDWDKYIRPQILGRDMFCLWGSIPDDKAGIDFVCGERAVEVDHIGDPNNHDSENLRGLCVYHHRIRTGRQGAAARLALMPQRNRPPQQHPGFK